MSINQLIATQYSRNKGPSPIQQLAGANQLQRQKQSLLAGEDKLNEAKRNRALKFAANMATEINQTEDPAKKAELYAASRQLAEMNGHDVRLLPTEYGDQAQGMLDAAYMQVYKPQEFESTLKNKLGMTSGEKEFNTLVKLIEPALDESGKFDPSRANAEQMAAAQKLYLVPKPQGSAAITTATTPGLTDAVADSESQITGQKEGAKLDAQIDKKPVLEDRVAEAKVLGKNRAEKSINAPKAEQKLKLLTSGIDSTIENIDEAISGVNWNTAGAGGVFPSKVPGTDAYDLKQTILSIRANIGFDKLQAMRDASPTGGALGQVAVQELEALQASIDSLDLKQSPAQLRHNLKKVRQHYENWREIVESAHEAEYGNAQQKSGSFQSKSGISFTVE